MILLNKLSLKYRAGKIHRKEDCMKKANIILIDEKTESKITSKRAKMGNYLPPSVVSMGEFSARTALGVSPAMKKKNNYVVSVLF